MWLTSEHVKHVIVSWKERIQVHLNDFPIVRRLVSNKVGVSREIAVFASPDQSMVHAPVIYLRHESRSSCMGRRSSLPSREAGVANSQNRPLTGGPRVCRIASAERTQRTDRCRPTVPCGLTWIYSVSSSHSVTFDQKSFRETFDR
jgi:hypothetical protein